MRDTSEAGKGWVFPSKMYFSLLSLRILSEIYSSANLGMSCGQKVLKLSLFSCVFQSLLSHWLIKKMAVL